MQGLYNYLVCGGGESEIPLKLTNPIYTNFYKDICHRLSREQRRSFELIHEHINSFNERLKKQEEVLENFTKAPNDENLQNWGSFIKGQYLHFREISWHIAFHLRNKDCPKLHIYDEAHKEYLQAIETHHKDMELILEKAKGLKPESFEKFYDEMDFENKRKINSN